jgi:hypothetical protein
MGPWKTIWAPTRSPIETGFAVASRFRDSCPTCPIPSFGPSAIFAGSAFLLTPPFGFGVPHWPRRRHVLLGSLLTSALRSWCLTALAVAEATPSGSPGAGSAAFRAQPPNLRFASLMDHGFVPVRIVPRNLGSV